MDIEFFNFARLKEFWRLVTLLNCTTKMVRKVNFILCIFYHSFFLKQPLVSLKAKECLLLLSIILIMASIYWALFLRHNYMHSPVKLFFKAKNKATLLFYFTDEETENEKWNNLTFRITSLKKISFDKIWYTFMI